MYVSESYIKDYLNPLAPTSYINEVALMFIKGTFCPGSDLFVFNGLLDSVVPLIFEYLRTETKSLFDLDSVAFFSLRELESPGYGDIRTSFSFPKRKGLYCNMMPFIIGHRSSLPPEYDEYYRCLISKLPFHPDEIGQVGYLTVDERIVEPGESHRRPGLHIESPGILVNGGEHGFAKPISIFWGSGDFVGDMPYGGIYMGSNISDTCCVWDLKLDRETAGDLGDIEHLRPYLGEGILLKSNEIYWITDTTPHESLPVRNRVYRQFFRVVTSNISVWYDEHSTRNPLVEPEAEIIYGSKFKDGDAAQEGIPHGEYSEKGKLQEESPDPTNT
eukprot:TRINITY_DN5014_c0_g1_i1.p1 TRINITY_DN5014_c0_g1~~TRINITY_DN5014_c0_g1_i1.p1  ORF type:complete len:331 (+),score=61.71 TRINITY_DN5014_c0_g1_i1:207-1199(+)